MSLTHVLLYIKIVNPTLCTFIKGLNSGMEAALSRPLGYNQREGGQQEVESKPLQPHLCVCVCVSGSVHVHTNTCIHTQTHSGCLPALIFQVSVLSL